MFVHLHTHSDNSILNGVIKVDKIIKKAKEYGMPAVALTDNGSMYPTYSFWSKCNAEGIKPIFGLHANLAPRTRFDKESNIDQKTSELVLLAKNLTGYLNLVKIVSYSHIEGFYYRPRIDKELLEKYHEGIILLSGGSYGEIQKNLYLGNDKEAEEIAGKYKEIFGEDFYLEIQKIGLHSEEIVNPKLIELSKKLGVKLVATNDVYYEKNEDAEVREVLWCIDGGRLMSDPSRRRPDSDQNYFKTPEEMEKLFEDLPEAVENTVKIAESVEAFNIGFGKVQPIYPLIPDGETEESYLRKLVFENAPERFGYFDKSLEDRLNYELEVIHDKGYDGYFLVVWSIVNWAKENDVLVSTRGSAAGCAVSYAISITTVDPIKWGLVFERFLNPERKSLPDIDLDISDHGRGKLVDWVKEVYGHENVSNVGALGKLTTKAAIRDVGRVLAIELNIIDKLSKLVPVTFGRVLSINAMLADELAGKDLKIVDRNREAVDEFRNLLKEDSADLKKIYFCEACQEVYFKESLEECKKCHGSVKVIAEVSPRFYKLVQYVRKIEGGIRNISTHACGHLITPKPVTDYCPVQVESGSGQRIITQFEGKYLEEVGLMKFDFLGLSNLSIIDYTIKFVREKYDKDFDIYKIAEDDPKAFELLRRGDTTAVFQLEGAGMRKYLKELSPESLEEICAMCALYRPGPMEFIPKYIARKHGLEPVEYLIPELEPILKITYGFAVYQEQILRIASDLCGYTLGAADNIRKAVGKKIAELMASEEIKFKEGFLEKNPQYGKDIAEKLWQYVLPFADYGFNKAHSAAYALVAYQTAYLKANYPTEFFAALMLSDIDNLDKLTRDILDAEAHDIKLLAPSVNKSDAYFRIEEEGLIRYGIGGLKGVGLKAIQSLVDERNKNGEFKNLDDLCARIDHKIVGKGAIELLIKIGAMDEFGKRAQLLQIFEEVYIRSQKAKQATSAGMMDMFGGGSTEEAHVNLTKLPNIPEVDDMQKIEWEKQILGVAVTPSLIAKLTPYFITKGYKVIHEVQESAEKAVIKIFGQITRINEITTKNGDQMCFLQVADISGPLSITIFPRTFEKCEELHVGDYLHVKGKTQKRNDEMQLLADEVRCVKDFELKTILEKETKKKAKETKKPPVGAGLDPALPTEKKPEVLNSSIANKPEVKIVIPVSRNENTGISSSSSSNSIEEKSDSKNQILKQVQDDKVEDKAQNSLTRMPDEALAKLGEPLNKLIDNINTINEPQTPYTPTSEQINKQTSQQISTIEIFVKKDTPVEELKNLSSLLKSKSKEVGAEVFVHIPNHTVVRKIKLEGKYDPDIKNLEEKAIERLEVK